MRVILRPMERAEFVDFERRTREGYAEDLATLEGSSAPAARRRAAEEHDRLLPHGAETPGHVFLVIQAHDGGRLGTVWFAEQAQDGARSAYLYDITVDEAHRGRGVGAAAMAALQEEVRERGLAWIDLTVAGSNEVARHLYDKLGYRTASVRMRKLLD